ncbi:MAG TPA: type II secretion system F family protein, partial [Rhizomicrobium sp.]|nr:type II secretion system F family protein [Rhizomicrobium sp.]
MTAALAMLCLVAAAVLSRPHWLPALTGTQSRVVLRRLGRFVPAWVRGNQREDGESKYLPALFRLAAADPTFAAFERALRAIGVASPWALLAAELAKLSGAGVCAVLVVLFLRWPATLSSAAYLAPLIAGLGFIVFVNGMVNRTAIARRRRVRSELALATEMLSIFLEGGQTLDQAFRGFADICGRALPRIAAVQRALVADLNNGISYEKAIARWSASLDVDEAKPLAALFIESLLHGTELVTHLRQISADLVESRIVAARASIGVKSAQL